jgi:hypothetical protein
MKSIVDNTRMFFSLPKKRDFHPISDMGSETWDRYCVAFMATYFTSIILPKTVMRIRIWDPVPF